MELHAAAQITPKKLTVNEDRISEKHQIIVVHV